MNNRKIMAYLLKKMSQLSLYFFYKSCKIYFVISQYDEVNN